MSKTVKIKPSHESQGEFVIISVDQFNPSEHELIEGESLPVDDNEVPNGALVPVEQFDELANKLIISEEQLLKAKEELMAFKMMCQRCKHELQNCKLMTPQLAQQMKIKIHQQRILAMHRQAFKGAPLKIASNQKIRNKS